MKFHAIALRCFCASLLLFSTLFGQVAPSPEAFFGFRVGSDRQLVDWQQITDYLGMLDGASDRIVLQELGKTTLGKPFLLAVISSEQNIRDLEQYRQIQLKLANPSNLAPEKSDDLIAEGKAVVLLSLNIHSTEIASSQESVELAWELATRDDPKIRRILDNVIILMLPSVNPDGLQIVTEWYRQHVGTLHEGSALPWLYHHYAGHDNNRDWFFFNLQESRLTSRILYRDWFPHIVYDQHQMGSAGPRFFVPPYSDPVNLNVHPILMAEMNMLGKHVISDMHDQDFKGVTTGMQFNAFFEGVMARTPIWHNMLGILSEAASAQVASPVFLPRGSLGRYGPERPQSATVTDFLDPWEGGWWRLRDIIDYEKAATYSILDLAATYRTKFLQNFLTMNADAIQKGETEAPYAYILPQNQHDPNAASEMLKRLDFNGIRIFRSDEVLTSGGRSYPSGTVVIPLAQPCRPAIKDLFERQRYPNMKMYPDGPPRPPYDFTGWTLPLLFGVHYEELAEPVGFNMSSTDDYSFVRSEAPNPSVKGFLVERRHNNAVILANELLKSGAPLFWTGVDLIHEEEMHPAGTFLIPNRGEVVQNLEKLSNEFDVPVQGISQTPPVKGTRVRQPRLGIYQSWTASMDEGWTRLALDNFRFTYKTLHNADIQKKNLFKSIDVLILPDMSPDVIVEGRRNPKKEPVLGVPQKPKEYQGGIGKEGVEALKDFVRDGGTLICLGRACDFAIEKLRAPAVNVIKDAKRKNFYAPGALLEAAFDLSHPIAYGMPEKRAVRVNGSPTFRLLPYPKEIAAVGYYEDGNPLLSGWLIGPEKIAGQTILAEIPVEKGRIVLFGFGVQSRAQTYGTFKLLFNAIFTSRTEPVPDLSRVME